MQMGCKWGAVAVLHRVTRDSVFIFSTVSETLEVPTLETTLYFALPFARVLKQV